MKLHIGETIRKCRTEREMTQEMLAELLGMAPQSVSRWESGISYPDIELLPSIANLFGISVDALIGMEAIRQEHDLHRIFTDAIDAEKAGNYDYAISVLRNGLRVYPGHDGLQCELALALGQTGRVPDRTEAIALSECVLSQSKNEKVRSTAKANLCCLYRDAGMKARAAELCRTLPHIWESREMVTALLAEDADAVSACLRARKIAEQVLWDLENYGTIAFSTGYRYP